VIGVVPDARIVVGVVDASPYTVQAYDAAGPPPYDQVQVGRDDDVPSTPANENDVIVTVGAGTGAADGAGGITASITVFLKTR
jgi:hypothetical protein